MATKQRLSGRKRKMDPMTQEAPLKKAKVSELSEQKQSENVVSNRQELQDKYHTKFPWTFWKFWQFCLEIADGGNPLEVLDCLNLQMVGPFEYLHGDLHSLSDEQILTHYRFYFDLPEFQTILLERNCPDHSHYGFWRDDPTMNPVGICKSKGTRIVLETAGKDTTWIQPMACDLFEFTRCRIQEMAPNHGEKKSISSLSQSLESFVSKHGIKSMKMGHSSCSFKKRDKDIVSSCFHRFGLVVPFENDIGYRPIGYSNRELKKILKRMHCDKQSKRKVKAKEMEMVLTNVCLADDEGDPGMGYELGVNFFFSYPMFAKKAQRLLCNAYALTQRNGFKDILVAHLKTRDSRKEPYSHLKGSSILRYTKKVAQKERVKATKSNLDELSSDDE